MAETWVDDCVETFGLGGWRVLCAGFPRVGGMGSCKWFGVARFVVAVWVCPVDVWFYFALGCLVCGSYGAWTRAVVDSLGFVRSGEKVAGRVKITLRKFVRWDLGCRVGRIS